MSAATTPSGNGGGGHQGWRLYASIALVIIVAIFILQNSKEVSVDFLFATVTAPLIFALLLAALLGLVIGLLMPRGRGGAKPPS